MCAALLWINAASQYYTMLLEGRKCFGMLFSLMEVVVSTKNNLADKKMAPFCGSQVAPIEHCLNATVHLSIADDHVYHFVATVDPSFDGYITKLK